MAIVNKTTLKSYFENGDTPTQSQFEDLIDTLFALTTSTQIDIGTANTNTINTTDINADSVQTDGLFEKTTDNGVNAEGNKLKDSQISTNGISYDDFTTASRTDFIDIGDWKMNTEVNVLVDVSSYFPDATAMKKIRSISVMIRKDDDDLYVDFSKGEETITATPSTQYISLSTTASSTFRTTDYDSLSYNRGFIVVKSVV